MKSELKEPLLWLLSQISRIALIAALLSGTITLLFFLRFDPEPPTDSQILQTMMENVYEDPMQETLKEKYRQWHYLSLGAYFSGRNQYNQGIVLTIIFTLIHFISIGLSGTIIGKPLLRKKGKINPFDITWEVAGLGLLILTMAILSLFRSRGGGSDIALPQTFISIEEASQGYWNSFLGPLNGTYESEAPDPDQLKRIWTLDTSRQGHSSPVIWEDQIYITGADEGGLEFMKVDLQKGDLLWKADFPVDPDTLPEVSFDTGWAPSTPVCDELGVYALFGNGSLIALDHSGELLWTKSFGVPDNPYGHASSLAIYQGRLFVQYDQSDAAFLKAFDRSDGRELWSRERPAGPSWSSPVPVFHEGRAMIITASDPRINAYNPYTGEEIWSTESLRGEVAPTICWDEERLYAVQEGAGVMALSLETGSVLWKNEEGPQSDVPSPTVGSMGLIMPTSYGILGLYDRDTGKLVTFAERFDSSYASPVLWGDLIFWPDMFGTLAVYGADEELPLLLEIPLGDEVLASPAISGDLMIIRSRESLSAWSSADE